MFPLSRYLNSQSTGSPTSGTRGDRVARAASDTEIPSKWAACPLDSDASLPDRIRLNGHRSAEANWMQASEEPSPDWYLLAPSRSRICHNGHRSAEANWVQ